MVVKPGLVRADFTRKRSHSKPAVQEGSGCMSREKKKKSLLMHAAGLAARGLLKRRIVRSERDLALLQAQDGRRSRAKVKKSVADAALYHALGGKASRESLQVKGRQQAVKKVAAASAKEAGGRKALKKAAAVSAAGVVVHKKRHRLVRRLLGAPILLLGRALIKKKKG